MWVQSYRVSSRMHGAMHVFSIEKAHQLFKTHPKRPPLLLRSSLFDTLQKNIAVLISDESHDFKNQ